MNNPTQEFIDKWIDNYMDKHPDERITDFQQLTEQATDAWWDKEADAGRPTPWDIVPKEKVKQKRSYTVNPDLKPKERKPNNEKREVMALLVDALVGQVENVALPNPEKEITFAIGENQYSISLICHRKPKT